MPQPKLKAFLKQNGVRFTEGKPLPERPARPKQARLHEMPGVVKLPQMSGHAAEAELNRLYGQLEESNSDEQLIAAMRQLACYTVTVDQLEAVPLGKRIKQLRQHSNKEVQQQATRLLQKMRQDVKDACKRSQKARPIVARLRRQAGRGESDTDD